MRDPCGQRDRDGADRPEPLQPDQPAATVLGRQELGHHGVIDGQCAAHCHAGQKAQHQKRGEIGCKDRGQTEERIATHRQQQHLAPADAVGDAPKQRRAGEHAQKEQRAGLQRLRHAQAEAGRDRGDGKADGDDLHRIRRPDQSEYAQKPPLKAPGTALRQGLVDGQGHARLRLANRRQSFSLCRHVHAKHGLAA